MSFDIDVLATKNEGLSWGALKHEILKWLNLLHQEHWGTELSLFLIKTQTSLNELQPLETEALYGLQLTIPSDITIHISRNYNNERSKVNELNYLEEYGVNLKPGEISELAARWQLGGYRYQVSSGKFRTDGEINLLITVVCAIANLCDGWVVVQDNTLLNCEPGIYSVEQFAAVRSDIPDWKRNWDKHSNHF